jgi:ribosomal-protein-alanine N-acetyltransferase
MASAPPVATPPVLSELALVIDTPRLRLRPIAEDDVDALWPHATDPQLSRYMSWSPHADKSETLAFVRSSIETCARGTDLQWAIEHEGIVAGCIGLNAIVRELRTWRVDRAELGYWIAAPLWGKGLMTEAATAATRWAFHTLRLHKVMVACLEENVGSRRVIEKVGFRLVGRFEDDVWRAGRWFSHLRYELVASEWDELARTQRFNRPRPT